MALKNFFRLRENFHKAKAFLQRPLQKVNRAMNKLRLESSSCSFNYQGYDEHYDLSQPLTAHFRYAPVREWLPPLHSRRGLDMTPIINFPYSYEDDLYITLYRLAPYSGRRPYVHCYDCLCGVVDESTRCLCMLCVVYHGVRRWEPSRWTPPGVDWKIELERE
ncbi:Uncharacterized protein PECH_000889 [Penicillium ucsense]|uniref:Uncharacterized protein n=1 Tax=Penicillium ucsense TaxID=2839758 RepID=A0A8J8W5J0_9EURO|nr:Uncharacterized protein PECM_005911 [Penicillium ucsense]KAF7736606.1 Uncharacterized protein PECH_000889 [Penicillium ucsense]